MTDQRRVIAGVPAKHPRPCTRCKHCGESVERLAEDGESILTIGKGQRFNLRKGTFSWNCKGCGSENTIALFEDGLTKSFRPGDGVIYDPQRTVKPPAR